MSRYVHNPKSKSRDWDLCSGYLDIYVLRFESTTQCHLIKTLNGAHKLIIMTPGEQRTTEKHGRSIFDDVLEKFAGPKANWTQHFQMMNVENEPINFGPYRLSITVGSWKIKASLHGHIHRSIATVRRDTPTTKTYINAEIFTADTDTHVLETEFTWFYLTGKPSFRAGTPAGQASAEMNPRRFEDAYVVDSSDSDDEDDEDGESESHGNPSYAGLPPDQVLAAEIARLEESRLAREDPLSNRINPPTEHSGSTLMDFSPRRTDFVMDNEGNILTAQPPPRGVTLTETSQFQVNMEAAMRRSRTLITRMFNDNTLGLDGRLPTRAHIPNPKTAPPVMMEEDEEPTSEPTRACYVCYTREACWVPPCNHIACKVCLLKLKLDEKSCPKCREPITNIKKIFF